MLPDAASLARMVSGDCGLQFDGRASGTGNDCILEIFPSGVPSQNTFAIRTVVGWRNVEVDFVPGAFAGDFIHRMGEADDTARACCSAILGKCVSDGASVAFRINGEDRNPLLPLSWDKDWLRLQLTIRRGQLDLDEGSTDFLKIVAWTQRAAAAIVALLPLEQDERMEENLQAGFPEGAKTSVQVNYYERDRRNRAAALAIHGSTCAVCQTDLGNRYGEVAAALVEVHHVTPVSRLGEGYRIDPAHDLIPLCPNCHRVAHRRDPPYTVDELRAMLIKS